MGDVAHVAARLFAALRQPCGQLGRQAFRRLQIGQFAQGRHAQPRRIEARLCRPWRQLQQLGQRRAALARQRAAPHGQLAIVALQSQRQQRVGRAIRGTQVGMPFGQAGWRGRHLQQRQRCAHRLAFAFRSNEFLQYLRRRADAVHNLRAHDGGVVQFHQAGLQGQQMAGQVAAVHRRDIHGLQRLERLRVVPVVEMPLEALQFPHAVQGGAAALDQLAHGEIAEIVGRQVGQQGQADIRRRGAVRHHQVRMLLHVIGRQPVIVRPDEGLEIGPGLARHAMQETPLLGRQARHGPFNGAADPPGDGGRGQPQQQHHGGSRQRCRAPVQQGGKGGQRQRGRAPHGAPAVCLRAGRRMQVRGTPVEQMLVRHAQAPQGAGDGIEADPGLIRQEDEGQHGMRKLHAAAPLERGQMLAPQGVARFAQQIVQGRKNGRQEDDGQHRHAPENHVRQETPHQQQGQGGGRRHDAAAQVVEQLPARQHRQGIAFALAGAARHAAQQPADQLPVAAYPALAAAHVGVVTGRVFLIQLRVAEQAGAQVAAFQ